MGKAIIAFILSVGVGTWLSFFNHGIGVVVSISIIGAFLIYQNENKKTSKKEGIPLPFFTKILFFENHAHHSCYHRKWRSYHKMKH